MYIPGGREPTHRTEFQGKKHNQEYEQQVPGWQITAEFFYLPAYCGDRLSASAEKLQPAASGSKKITCHQADRCTGYLEDRKHLKKGKKFKRFDSGQPVGVCDDHLLNQESRQVKKRLEKEKTPVLSSFPS